MHPDEHIHYVESITDIVHDHPGGGDQVVQLPEDGPTHHHNQVVEHSHVDQPQPLNKINLQR